MSNLFGRLLSRGRKEVEGREAPMRRFDENGREILYQVDQLHKVSVSVGSFENTNPDTQVITEEFFKSLDGQKYFVERAKEKGLPRFSHAVAISLEDLPSPNDPGLTIRDLFRTETVIFDLDEKNFAKRLWFSKSFGTKSLIYLIDKGQYTIPDHSEALGKIEDSLG